MSDRSGGGHPDRVRLDVTPLGNGRYRLFDGARHRIAYAAGPSDARWVFLDGHVFVINAAAPQQGRRVRARSDESALSAPMPATVTVINVAPGQQVVQGDVLLMLEAMKMELAVKAPRDGRVRTVSCREGELVRPGVPLVELE